MKKKKPKFTLSSEYVLLIFTVLCVIMIFVTFNTNLTAGPLRGVASYVLVPLQKGINQVGIIFSNWSDDLTNLRDVMAENKKLQEKVDELTTENNILQQDKYELNRLRELYKLDEKYPDYNKVGARIIAKDAGNWFHTFVIDKGSDDGIQIDMNVIAGSGLVGRVTAVSPNSASVLAIIDDSSNVAAQILSTSDRCIVSGNLQLMNENKISISKLTDPDNKVSSGEKVVTSNISDKYLPGILIGYVDEIGMDSNNLTKSGTLRPAVDFSHLEEVLVILELKKEK
ncbi:MAG: rod shape-determining protein MreC [Lachnospiraceae bacterium]|nr:rod shape-determining protein MreC [Lachnospiraceae bacterium]